MGRAPRRLCNEISKVGIGPTAPLFARPFRKRKGRDGLNWKSQATSSMTDEYFAPTLIRFTGCHLSSTDNRKGSIAPTTPDLRLGQSIRTDCRDKRSLLIRRCQ